MAYKQSPGRQMMPKTGAGIPPVLMCGSPMKQDKNIEKSKQVAATAKRAVEKFKSNKKLGKKDYDIELAAAGDSIVARNKAFIDSEGSAGKTMLDEISNKAANKTRSVNQSSVTVKKEKQNPRTGLTTYTKKKVVN